MKIQEALSSSEPGEGCEDVPRLDLSSLTDDSNWGGESASLSLSLSFFSLPLCSISLSFLRFFLSFFHACVVSSTWVASALSSWGEERHRSMCFYPTGLCICAPLLTGDGPCQNNVFLRSSTPNAGITGNSGFFC